jgi:hypothetical protein
VSVKRPVAPVPPPPSDQIIRATLLYGVLLLLASKLGVSSTDLTVPLVCGSDG